MGIVDILLDPFSIGPFHLFFTDQTIEEMDRGEVDEGDGQWNFSAETTFIEPFESFIGRCEWRRRKRLC